MASLTQAALIKKLRATRPGYEQEGILHEFLRDSYTGGGGFRNGQVPMPEVTFWGRTSYERGGTTWLNSYYQGRQLFNDRSKNTGGPARKTWSYLEPFPGEDTFAYLDRVNCSTYTNPIEPIVHVTNAFLHADDAQRDELPPPLSAWIPNANGERQHIREIGKNMTFRCQLVGWGTTVADLPQAPARANFAESLAAGHAPYLTNFWPQEILDWDLNEKGELIGLKISTHHEMPRESMLSPKRYSEHITLWYPDHWERYVIEEEGPESSGSVRPKVLDKLEGPNPFGRVPAVFCRWDEPISGPVFTGMPQVLTLAQIARKLFNQNSELDYMMRSQVFGQLVGPQRNQGVSKPTENVGWGNFLEEPEGAKGIWRYIQPSGESAATYEKALERGKRDVYRIALIDPGEGRAAETAESRRLRFQQTESMLGTMAGNLERWEAEIYRLVAPVLRVSESDLEKIAVRRKRSYAIQVLSEQLESTMEALDLPIGPVAKTALVRRALRTLLPDTAEKEFVTIDAEVETLVKELEDVRKASAKLLAENGTPPGAPFEQPPPGGDGKAQATPQTRGKAKS